MHFSYVTRLAAASGPLPGGVTQLDGCGLSLPQLTPFWQGSRYPCRAAVGFAPPRTGSVPLGCVKAPKCDSWDQENHLPLS